MASGMAKVTALLPADIWIDSYRLAILAYHPPVREEYPVQTDRR